MNKTLLWNKLSRRLSGSDTLLVKKNKPVIQFSLTWKVFASIVYIEMKRFILIRTTQICIFILRWNLKIQGKALWFIIRGSFENLWVNLVGRISGQICWVLNLSVVAHSFPFHAPYPPITRLFRRESEEDRVFARLAIVLFPVLYIHTYWAIPPQRVLQELNCQKTNVSPSISVYQTYMRRNSVKFQPIEAAW